MTARLGLRATSDVHGARLVATSHTAEQRRRTEEKGEKRASKNAERRNERIRRCVWSVSATRWYDPWQTVGCKMENQRERKTTVRRGFEEGRRGYANPSKDEREVQANSKTGQFRDNRGASDGRLSGVWWRRDAPRAARHSRRDNESSLPCCS